MKIVQINATCGIGSTGKICVGISQILTAQNIENYILCSRTNGYSLGIPCADSRYIKLQALKSKVLGNYGFNSQNATRRIITELERIRPDVVHLHNIHGHDCDLDMLFAFFRRKKTKLLWTFHDCWAFTGYCTYFTMVNCNKWKSHCKECVQKRKYSLLLDKSQELHKKKKKLSQEQNITIVTPSQWLADVVKQSFLREYPVYIVYNGINLDDFKPTLSKFREKFGIENKKIVLDVSFEWGARKGLDVFLQLASRLPDDYQVVLVGTDANVDKILPPNIISIHRTQNQQELAEIYSVADVFVNPTREDNFPTVNMEALACGTPVLTFRTGGGPEIIDETCGSVVECDDVDTLEREIIRICETKPYSLEQCLKKAQEFDQNQRFKEYLDLYERVNSAGN